jgi:predicted metal-dependent phosphoesterase TrpH
VHRHGPPLLDLHAHTTWSDGLATPKELVHRARELGVTVAVTDHNVIEGALEAWSLAGDERLVVPGIEITTLERVHLLIYFRTGRDLSRFFARSVAPHRPRGATATTVIPRPAEAFLEELRHLDHLTAAAHPFAVAKNGWMSARARYGYLGQILDELAGIEVCNGEELDAGNERASLLARQRGIGGVAGSDAHTLPELGGVCLELPDSADLFECVRGREGRVLDRRQGGAWRRLLGHGAKLPYFVLRPGVAAWRYATGETGDGPHTTQGLGVADEET